MNRHLNIQVPLEAEEAKTFWQWAQYHPIAKDHLVHNANESKTSWANGRHLKAQGKRAGLSDYLLAYPYKGKPGLWIELKRRKRSISRLSEEQAQWLERMNRCGYSTAVAYGSDEAIRAVEEYLK